MTKVEMEKPVVSEELAEAFEKVKGNCEFPSSVCDLSHYACDSKISEYENLNDADFEKLLIDMYSRGYEIKKPKLKYIRLRALHIDCKRNYLNLNTLNGTYFVDDCERGMLIKVEFTQEEVDEFFKDEPISMWVVENVVSDND